MATATLTDGPAVQLTFPWALPKAEEESPIVAERRPEQRPLPSSARSRGRAPRRGQVAAPVRVTVERHATSPTSVASAASSAAPPQAAINDCAIAPRPVAAPTAVATASAAQCADSVQEALCGDRIGKPVRIGAVMFRLLKRYGITDEEIAEGVAAYNAKRAGVVRA